MLRSSIRSIASINLRATVAPRAVVPAARTLASRLQTSTRIINPNVLGVIRTFGVSAHRLGEGLADKDLVHKLTEEILFEKDNDAGENTPQFITEFLNNNSFKIEDHTGVAEVALTRTFGNEKIRVAFSVDMNQFDEPFEEDDAGNAENAEERTQADDDESDEGSSLPVHATVTIEKSGKGAISIDITSQDGSFMINNVLFYEDGKLATDKSSEADTKRQSLYLGPEFSQLEEALQVQFERYLEERGINTALALFIPYYSEYKEQKEYTRWLGNMKNFVEA